MIKLSKAPNKEKQFEIIEHYDDKLGKTYNQLYFYGQLIPCSDIVVHDSLDLVRTATVTVNVID